MYKISAGGDKIVDLDKVAVFLSNLIIKSFFRGCKYPQKQIYSFNLENKNNFRLFLFSFTENYFSAQINFSNLFFKFF